ncbi:MAG: hypothetical protein DRQ61_05990 [Gammaproteobacteria bacterium]|nr:MAG: hypothetical protein DRQ61_05990 [Gammaproteobacteria bacterium]
MKRFALFCFLSLCFGVSHSAVIQLSNGDTINADILERTGSDIKISHPAMGKIALPIEKITTIDGKILATPAVISENEQSPSPHQPDENEEADKGFHFFDSNFRLLRGWKHKIGAGFNGKQGNTNTTTIRAEYRGNFEDQLKRWDIRTVYDLNSGDENDAQNEYYVQATRDWLRPDSLWFYFAMGKYEWDEFKNWDHKIGGTLGTGYEFIKRQDLLLLGRFGFSIQNTIGGSDPGLDPELMFGGDMDKTFSEIHSLKLKTAFYQSLTDSSSWRNITNLDWDIVVNQLWGLGLTISLQNEYESRPDAGDVESDFKYNISLVLGWDS